MKTARLVGILIGAVALAISALTAGIVWAYLTEYGPRRIAIVAGIAVVGVGAASLAYLLVMRVCRKPRCALILLSLVAVLLLIPILSMFYPGRVTYSRFGLTVVGVIPVPVLDLAVGPHGGLWFRDKSHFVSLDEVQVLLSSGVEGVVMGTGWYRAVQVDPAIQAIERVEVTILPTPAAFDLFNEYRSRGQTVVLIAHSTC